MKKVLKFVKGSKKDGDPSASGNRGSKESVCLPTSSSNDSLNNNGYHVDIYGADKNMNKLHKSAYQGKLSNICLVLYNYNCLFTVTPMSRSRHIYENRLELRTLRCLHTFHSLCFRETWELITTVLVLRYRNIGPRFATVS